jgi:hypothetical protein
MGDVIPMPRRAARKSDTAVVLGQMMTQESTGELEGSIHIAATRHGTEFHVLGTCADRLQLGVVALVKGLNFVTDQIIAKGAIGNTPSASVRAAWEAPKRRLPKRLQEATKLGDLE